MKTTLPVSNQERLRSLMRKHRLSAGEVGVLTLRKDQTVRGWMCGAVRMPDHALALLALKLAGRE